MEKITVSVSILGQTITLATSHQEAERVRQAIEYASQVISRVQSKSPNLSSERTAIMACIQLASELQNMRANDGPLAGVPYGKIQEKLAEINKLLDEESK